MYKKSGKKRSSLMNRKGVSFSKIQRQAMHQQENEYFFIYTQLGVGRPSALLTRHRTIWFLSFPLSKKWSSQFYLNRKWGHYFGGRSVLRLETTWIHQKSVLQTGGMVAGSVGLECQLHFRINFYEFLKINAFFQKAKFPTLLSEKPDIILQCILLYT